MDRVAQQVVDIESPDDVALADRMKHGRDQIIAELHKLIIGQADTVQQVLLSLFVGGNSLIVGVPGLAKTLLIHTLARVLELKFARIQFTPDLMPSDITGTDIIQEDTTTGRRQMVFAPGPIFANIVLADEINRTPPKTQSALLEAMQEHRVTIQGRTYQLEEPFYVFATQNPIELEGTYPLPEAQLDRFMFHIVIDHPPEDEEFEVVRTTTAILDPKFERPVSGEDLIAFQRLVRRVPVAEPVMRYALSLVRASRPKSPTGARSDQEVGGVWRQRPRRAVPRARRESAGHHQRPLSRQLRRRPGAGASGAAPPRADELPRAVRRHHQRRADRSAARGRAGAEVGDVGRAGSRFVVRVHGSVRGSQFEVQSSLQHSVLSIQIAWINQPFPAPGSWIPLCSRASGISSWSRARSSTASSTAFTARPTSVPPSISPSTGAMCRATTSAAWTGSCTRAPTAIT